MKDFYKNILSLLYLLYIIVVIISCADNKQNSHENSFRIRKIQKINRVKKRFINSEIKGFEKIIKSDTIKNDCFSIFFVYKGNDCGSCIEESSQILDSLGSLLPNNLIKCIKLRNNIYNEKFQFLNKYSTINGDTLFSNSVIHAIYTPMFALVSNIDYTIINIYLSVPGIDQKIEKNSFIDNCIMKNL